MYIYHYGGDHTLRSKTLVIGLDGQISVGLSPGDEKHLASQWLMSHLRTSHVLHTWLQDKAT